MRPNVLDALEDIVEHIEYILEDIDGVSWSFSQEDRRTRQLVMYNSLIIGEAANRISKERQIGSGGIPGPGALYSDAQRADSRVRCRG